MYIEPENCLHLTYCSNIHPAHSWQEVLANMQAYIPDLKARFAPHKAFGSGLWLSNQMCAELLQGEALPQFAQFLREQNFYIFTLNGSGYDTMYRQTPDWLQEERVAYTLRLIEVLSVLLPANLDGSISTCPLSYKAEVSTGDAATWEHITHNIVRVALALVRLRREQGKLLHLNIEPEPGGLLESSEDIICFYTHQLLEEGARMLAHTLCISRREARNHLLEHIRIGFDTGHMAVVNEDPADLLDRFEQVGIQVGKIQISSALKVNFPADESARTNIARALTPFVESAGPHQVVQQNRDGSRLFYPDLLEALPQVQDQRIAQWRIHAHVPVFSTQFPLFLSTQETILDVFRLLAQRPFCRHLEIETSAWNVLPEQVHLDLLESIAREYEWVLRHV